MLSHVAVTTAHLAVGALMLAIAVWLTLRLIDKSMNESVDPVTGLSFAGGSP